MERGSHTRTSCTDTITGTFCGVVYISSFPSPIPNSPYSLFPHANTSPSLLSPRVWMLPVKVRNESESFQSRTTNSFRWKNGSERGGERTRRHPNESQRSGCLAFLRCFNPTTDTSNSQLPKIVASPANPVSLFRLIGVVQETDREAEAKRQRDRDHESS